MNFMRIKKIGKMATAAIIAFIAVVVFINPQKAQASQGGAVTVTATSNYVLVDSHNVDISITAYVEYAYDEGAYGWVINIIPQSWSKTSDNVTIDNMDYEDDYGYQTSTATYVFHYTAHAAFGEGNYDGYATFKFYVDEWGDFDYWLE